METSITLALPYDLTEEQWAVVDDVFKSLDGWIGYSEEDRVPQWYGVAPTAPNIWASSEPSGLMIGGELVGKLADEHWTGWISVLCARLSLRLGIEICDASM
jgi:hypothetical protein